MFRRIILKQNFPVSFPESKTILDRQFRKLVELIYLFRNVYLLSGKFEICGQLLRTISKSFFKIFFKNSKINFKILINNLVHLFPSLV
uniref:Uncharacterized protein n=1 Tax=Meloidogyne enterolobii TaxID=390850 RepID=A0A6V7UYU2_MELEN|nr:unnamed protein product [Meloidogyne enterolobii]